MKKKRRLMVFAIVLAGCLTVGGVMMLFTAKTGSATNVVTVGTGIKAVLVERYNEGGDWVVGHEYIDHIQPGQTVHKEPKVMRLETGSEIITASDAYVRVKVELQLPAAPTNTVFEFKDAEVQDLFEKILRGIYYNEPDTAPSISESWVFERDIDEETGEPALSGYFYYVEDTADKQLKALPSPNETPTIFTDIKVPDGDTLTGRELELFAMLVGSEKGINLKLTAFLVQVDNNEYTSELQAGHDPDYSLAFSNP